MAKEQTNGTDGTAQGKYGPQNMMVSMDGDDLILRIDTTQIIGRKGELKDPERMDDDEYANNPKNTRKRDLIATSNGFMRNGVVSISLNVLS